ncbi:hypothetical protein LUZ62_061422 [Rhynchospora pubera]|uniref:Uncharacterized protein n=1 Tax=Rhynchospora pubera TaxID=906938 RepID=A0AAV8EC46_9POAL|nr:hypothetical protein LUZ62_061422 [Rhynchospora pubera]
MNTDKRKKKPTDGGGGGGDDAAVEELLRAAQDDVLLNLRVNSHSVGSDAHFSSLDPDLMRRFDALRSKPSVPSSSNSHCDDLEARFAKLKGGVGSEGGGGSVGSGGVGESGMEDEVEKVMKWAMDSVRLDQSSGKSTGEVEEEKEEEVGETVTSSESESSDDDEENEGNGKMKEKAKAEKKKWFFQR